MDESNRQSPDPTSELEPLLTTEQVASYTNRSLASLAVDRARGVGLPYVKMGRLVRYRLSDVIAYTSQLVVPPQCDVARDVIQANTQRIESERERHRQRCREFTREWLRREAA